MSNFRIFHFAVVVACSLVLHAQSPGIYLSPIPNPELSTAWNAGIETPEDEAGFHLLVEGGAGQWAVVVGYASVDPPAPGNDDTYRNYMAAIHPYTSRSTEKRDLVIDAARYLVEEAPYSNGNSFLMSQPFDQRASSPGWMESETGKLTEWKSSPGHWPTNPAWPCYDWTVGGAGTFDGVQALDVESVARELIRRQASVLGFGNFSAASPQITDAWENGVFAGLRLEFVVMAYGPPSGQLFPTNPPAAPPWNPAWLGTSPPITLTINPNSDPAPRMYGLLRRDFEGELPNPPAVRPYWYFGCGQHLFTLELAPTEVVQTGENVSIVFPCYPVGGPPSYLEASAALVAPIYGTTGGCYAAQLPAGVASGYGMAIGRIGASYRTLQLASPPGTPLGYFQLLYLLPAPY